MISVGDVDGSPGIQRLLVFVFEPLQPVHIVKVPGDRSEFPVDLESVQRFVAPRVPACLEDSERTIFEPCYCRASVIYSYIFHFPG